MSMTAQRREPKQETPSTAADWLGALTAVIVIEAALNRHSKSPSIVEPYMRQPDPQHDAPWIVGVLARGNVTERQVESLKT